MTPRLLTALNQNGAAIPSGATITPPKAGPTARLRLTPTLLAAIAGLRSDLGTNCGTTACQAGNVSAPAALLDGGRPFAEVLPGIAQKEQETRLVRSFKDLPSAEAAFDAALAKITA